MIEIVSDLETYIADNPMPPPMKDVFLEPGSSEEYATYNMVGGYIMKKLFAGEDIRHVDLVLRLDRRIDGIGIFRAGFDVMPAEMSKIWR